MSRSSAAGYVLLLVVLAVSACSGGPADDTAPPVGLTELSVDCGPEESFTMADGTVVTYYDAWAPLYDTPTATVCTGDDCSPAQVFVVQGLARVICGKEYARGGTVLSSPADYVVFAYGGGR